MIVLFRDIAEAELDEARARYAEINEALANRFLDAVDAALERAASDPSHYQVVAGDVRHVRLRRFPHALYFRIVGNALVVIACFHPSRDPANWLERR